MSNIAIGIPMENRHISSSLMEKILSVNGNSLVPVFFSIYKTEATGKGIKNITINNAGEMTFLPKGKESILETTIFPNVWKKDNRQSGSFGKILRKLLVENGIDSKSIVAKELEEIVNSLKARYTVEGSFEVVSGSDITKYYLFEKYDETFNLGTLENSCMRHSGLCQEATLLYAENENCEMVVLKSPEGDFIRGRALLWKDRHGKKWLDRIYACDHVQAAFKQFAHSNGWPHKSHQDSCVGDWVFPNGKQAYEAVFIEMDTDYRPLPYMDTFYHITDSHCHNDEDSPYDYYAQSEPGQDDDGVYDDITGNYIFEDDAVYIDNRDIYTHVDNAFYCGLEDGWFLNEDGVRLSNGNMAWAESSEIVFSDSSNGWLLMEEARYCEYSEEWFDESEVTFLEPLGIDVHEDRVDDAYENAGWVQDENNEWVNPQLKLI